MTDPKARDFLSMCVQQNRRVWIRTTLRLQDVMTKCPNPRAWGKIADHNAIPSLLHRPAEDCPERRA